jgi:hypothetical protein
LRVRLSLSFLLGAWDLRDASGAVVHAGLYLVRMEAEGKRFTQRLMVAQ